MLDRFTLQNMPKFWKVIHIFYISFLVTIKGDKLGGISEKISKKIGYNFRP